MTDRMTVAEARDALEKAGYWAGSCLLELTAVEFMRPGDYASKKYILADDNNTVSRASVNELVERAKR